jgi:hypothetical protein
MRKKVIWHVHTVARPYVLIGPSGTAYPLSPAEAQRILDEAWRIISARPRSVRLRGDDGIYHLAPATLGGGPAFVICKE